MPDPIVLEPADYWKLKALIHGVQLAREQARTLVAAASAAHDAHVTALRGKYPALVLDQAPHRMDDDSCALIRQE